MREIRFRGKRKDDTIHNGTWVYGHYFTAPLTDENSGLPAEAGWFFLSGGEKRHCIEQDGLVFTVDPATVGQFTGEHEKLGHKGREIYEGDVVEINTLGINYEHKIIRGVVEFVDGCFEVSFDPTYDISLKTYRQRLYVKCFVVNRAIKVISNIHDSLLEVK